MRFILFLLIFTFSVRLAFAQNGDCATAINLCQPTYTVSGSPLGAGNNSTELGPGTCLLTGEGSSVWFNFTTANSGFLAFTISPITISDDFDWAIYDLNEHACSAISIGEAPEIACNYSGISGNTGMGGLGPTFEAPIFLDVNKVYVLIVSKFSASNTGFTLDFQVPNNQINIAQGIAPSLVKAEAGGCGSSNINVIFNTDVLLSSVSPNDFLIQTALGTTLPVVAVNSYAGNNGGLSDRVLTLTLAQPIATSGQFSVQLSGIVQNGCGLNSVVNPTVVFSVQAFVGRLVTDKAAICAGDTARLTARAQHGLPPYTYTWDHNASLNSATIQVNPQNTTTYWVNIADAGGCFTRVSRQVVVNQLPTGSWSAPNDTLCFGDLLNATFIVDSGFIIDPFEAFSFDGQNFQASPNFIDYVSQDTLIQVWVRLANGCVNGPFFKQIFVKPLPSAAFIVSPPLCNQQPTGSILVKNLTTNGPWMVNGQQTIVDSILLLAITGGTNIISVTNGLGCTNNLSVNVPQPNRLRANRQLFNNSCAGIADGQISVTPIGGTPPYQISWSNGQAGGFVSGLSAGNYAATIIDANGCQLQQTYQIEQPQALQVTSFKEDVNCYLGNDGKAWVVLSGGTYPYTYNWIGVNTSDSMANHLSAGFYQLHVMDSLGCSDSVSWEIGMPYELTASPIIQHSSCGISTGSIFLEVNGGTPPYAYFFNNQQEPTPGLSQVTPGNYSFVVKDSLGCEVPGLVQIQNRSPQLSITAKGVNCIGGSDGEAMVQINGGRPPYQVQLYRLIGLNKSWIDSLSGVGLFNNLPFGNYRAILTDSLGCTDSLNFFIRRPIIQTRVLEPIVCFGDLNGKAEVSIAAANGPIQVLWMPSGEQSFSALNLAGGWNTVTVQYGNGLCTLTDSLWLGNPTPLLLTSITKDADCGGNTGQISLTPSGGSGNYTFSWTPSIANNALVDSLGAGFYQVRVEDGAGCSISESFEILGNTPIQLTTITTQALCTDSASGSARVNIFGGVAPYAISWQPFGGNDTIASHLTAGFYTVSVTDSTECLALQTVEITEKLPQIRVIRGNVSCIGFEDGFLRLVLTEAAPPYNIHLIGQNGFTRFLTTNSNVILLDSLPADNYDIFITDSVGCEITVKQTIVAPRIQSTLSHVTCNRGEDGSISIQATNLVAPITYSWLPNVSSGPIASNLKAGIYQVTITDARGCVFNQSFQITHPTQFYGLAQVIAPTCFGSQDGKATILLSQGSGSYQFQWSPRGSGTNFSGDLSAGNYEVLVTDLGTNNCALVKFTVTSPTRLRLAQNISPVSCPSGNNGSININPIGGTPPYQIFWADTGLTGFNVSGLSAGSYFASISDANGCIVTRNNIIKQNDSFAIAPVIYPVSCNGVADGRIKMFIQNGASPFSFHWLHLGLQSDSVGNLFSGNYEVLITDSLNCRTSHLVNMPQPPQLQVNIVANQIQCAGDSTGNLLAQVSGGTPPYRFFWNNGDTIANPTGLIAGRYILEVLDKNNCSVLDTVTISDAPNQLQVSLFATSATCNNGADGKAWANISGGLPPYQYFWVGQSVQNDSLTSISAGWYTIIVTDARSCIKIDSIYIDEPQVFSLGWQVDSVICNGEQNGAINLNTSRNGQFVYQWAHGPQTRNVGQLFAGTYQVRADGLGSCAEARIEVTEPDTISIEGVLDQVWCSGGNNGSIKLSVQGGNGGFQYFWQPNGQQTDSLNFLSSGIYHVLVTDRKGCTKSKQFNITQPLPLTANVLTYSVSCTGGSDGSIKILPTGGTSPYRFNWIGLGVQTDSVSGLRAGNYQVMISDSFGCSRTEQITLPENAVILPYIISKGNVSCKGGSDGFLIVGANGGDTAQYQYSWPQLGASGQAISALPPGIYTISIVDGQNCAFLTDTIFDPLTDLIINNTISQISCFNESDGQIQISPSGGTPPYSYFWLDNYQTTPNRSFLPNGSYSVLVTDSIGCKKQVDFNLSNPDTLAITVSTQSNICANNPTGSASVVVIGGKPPYQITWADNNTSFNRLALAAGVYHFTITDSSGCTKTDSVFIAAPSKINTTQSTIANANCYNELSGIIILSISGGTAPYSVFWIDNGSTLEDRINLKAGRYIVRVSDSLGCTILDTFNISQPDSLFWTLLPTDLTACKGSEIALLSQLSGGVRPYTYRFNNNGVFSPDSVYLFLPQQTTWFQIAGTDANGCYIKGSDVKVQVFDSLTINIGEDQIACTGMPVRLFASVKGGTPMQSRVVWSNGDTTQSIRITPTQTTIVYAEIWDDCNQIAIRDSVLITIEAAPIPNFVLTNESVCLPSATQFTDLSVVDLGTAYYWDFGDGVTTNSAGSQTYKYLRKGCFTPSLTLVSPLGCEKAITHSSSSICTELKPIGQIATYLNEWQPLPPNFRFNQQFTLNAKTQYTSSLLWDFGDGFTTTVNPTSHKYSQPGEYLISLVLNQNNLCFDTISFKLNAKDTLHFYIPNAFSPNNDGINETFRPVASGINSYLFEIYDRWGNLVFVTNNVDEGWNGNRMQNGAEMPTATYAWHISYTNEDGNKKTLGGIVHLIR